MKNWPDPGDLILRKYTAVIALAWNEPGIASGTVDIGVGEACIVIIRALNPGSDWAEQGYDERAKRKWVRTWWMVMRSNARLVWIHESHMETYYDVVRTSQCSSIMSAPT